MEPEQTNGGRALSFWRMTTLAAIAVLTGALTASAQEPPVDHVWLSVDPVRLGNGWNLTASVTSPDFDPVSGDEILGVTLERKLSGRARETHALRAHVDVGTVSFDGREGRWRTAGKAGKGLRVDLTIVAAGEPAQVAPNESLPFACRGSFVRVPVRLAGMFAVRTGTRTFRSITRTRLSAVLTYNGGGPVECGLATPRVCEPAEQLSASGPSATGVQSLSVDRKGRSLVVQFTDRPGGWAHVLFLSRVDALVGELPTIGVRVPGRTPVAGKAAFVGGKTTESLEDGCRTTTADGSLTGSLRVRFSAWGTRTFAAPPTRGRLSARYRVTTER
jgi:hypothetical protein